MTYGINSNLCVDLLNQPQKPVINFDKYAGKASNVLVFADSAQVNTFQTPASPSNPMIEEWYYITPQGELFVHFRHNQKTNILFGDGHVSDSKPESDSIDRRLPDFNIGRLGKEIRF